MIKGLQDYRNCNVLLDTVLKTKEGSYPIMQTINKLTTCFHELFFTKIKKTEFVHLFICAVIVNNKIHIRRSQRFIVTKFVYIQK